MTVSDDQDRLPGVIGCLRFLPRGTYWRDAGAPAGQAHARLEVYLPAAACEILVRMVKRNRPEGGQGSAPGRPWDPPMSEWQQARHEGDVRPWTSYSLILADGSRIVVSPDWQQPGAWKWARYRTGPGGDEDAQASCTGFTSARRAMGDAQEAGALLAFEEKLYVASWAEEKDQRGAGAASSWVPMPFGQAMAIIIAELRRNLDLWRGIGGSDPALYDQALERLEAAAGPLAITLPGHVLRIEDTRRNRAS